MTDLSLPLSIVKNEKQEYPGDLKHYFRLLFHSNGSFNHYHNFRHGVHVLCQGYEAVSFCEFNKAHNPRSFRALFIALLMHDYSHNGVMGDDHDTVAYTLFCLEKKLWAEDYEIWPEIRDYIAITEYPYRKLAPTLGGKIMRDADRSQIFSDVWLQQSLLGLSREMGVSILEMLHHQEKFINELVFETTWADEKFQHSKVAKLKEIRALLGILT